jgi:uncharacterized membrane protein (UPF0127 family)
MKKGSVSVLADQGAVRYDVLIPDQLWEYKMGLMGVEYLHPGTGMLFLFDAPEFNVRRWMKNVPISIDMICINGQKKIYDMCKNKIPFDETISYPSSPMIAMLEVNAGECDKNEFKLGQVVEWVIHPRVSGGY